jgi:hypothetical protein
LPVSYQPERPPSQFSIPHVVRGKVVDGGVQIHETADGSRFATPALDLDKLVWPRTWPLPAAEVPVAEIIEVLTATGSASETIRMGAGWRP